jgi:hypothetical protein
MTLAGDFLEPGTLVDVTVTGHEGSVLTVTGDNMARAVVAQGKVSGDRT